MFFVHVIMMPTLVCTVLDVNINTGYNDRYYSIAELSYIAYLAFYRAAWNAAR